MSFLSFPSDSGAPTASSDHGNFSPPPSSSSSSSSSFVYSRGNGESERAPPSFDSDPLQFGHVSALDNGKTALEAEAAAAASD